MSAEGNENYCPNRGWALGHVDGNTAGTCRFCGQKYEQTIKDVISNPADAYPWSMRGPIAVPSTAGSIIPVGLLDGVLDMRHRPITETMLGDPTRKSVEWQAHTMAIDAVLDLLVPALKKIVTANTIANHPNCQDRQEIDRIIGRVPLRRTPKGWE